MVVHDIGVVVFVHSSGFGAGVVEPFGEEVYAAAGAGQVWNSWVGYRCGICGHSLVLLSGFVFFGVRRQGAWGFERRRSPTCRRVSQVLGSQGGAWTWAFALRPPRRRYGATRRFAPPT